MGDAVDLFHASRDELVALVVGLRERNADLERRLAWQAEDLARLQDLVTAVTERVGAVLAAQGVGDGALGPPPGMPGLKGGPAPERTGAARRKRTGGFGRARMVPTARQVHAIDACPACRIPLRGGAVVRTREVIEVPAAPAVVTAHAYVARTCPRCGGRWQPGPDLDGAVVGQGRLGIGLLGLIVWLREELRLPVRAVQQYLAQRHGLALSVGAVVGATRTVAARAEAVVAGQLAAIRGSPVVHADETGWREDGKNGYVWTLSTPEARYFVHGGRDRAMLETALGADFAGVLVSDFSAAYTTFDGARHQYCWAHLLRDVDELVRRHPRDAGVRGWADAVHRCFARAKAGADPDPAGRTRARQRCEAELLAVCAPHLRPPPPTVATAGGAPTPALQAGLCRRIDKHLGELFVFVEDPTVPPTNNAAERSLRHLVTCRKISGGTRSATGTATKMTLASLFGTWRALHLDPLDQCRQLLAAPQV